jgi:hypothetical protein
MTIKVEFGFDKNPVGQFIYLDITSFVKSVSVSRGKQNNLGPFNAGQASVELDNRGRTFDPTYTASPYFGQIQPTGSLRLSRDGLQIFEGTINDWNLSYTVDGQSVATVVASDALTLFTNQTYGVDTSYSPELSSVRLGNVLNVAAWPSDKRRISEGKAVLESDDLVEGDNLLDYMQKIELSEAGRLFVDRTGYIVFKTRNDNAYGSAYTFFRYNLCKNPSFEVDTLFWSAGTRSTAQALYGSASLSVPTLTSITYPQESVSPYTLSLFVKAVSGTATVTLSAQQSVDGVTYSTAQSSVDVVTSSEWTRVDVSYVSDFDKEFGQLLLSTTGTVYIDGVLIENSSNLGEYFDGTVKPANDAVTTYVSSWDGIYGV